MKAISHSPVNQKARGSLRALLDGELDGAHMLAGQPLWATIGFGTKVHVITAFENVALGVEKFYSHPSPVERTDIIEYCPNRVGLGGALHKKALELSNGMRQRIGIARACALSLILLLLDDPSGCSIP